MIIFIEGCRHSGKTYLLDRFNEQKTDPRVEYYKFKFAKYIDLLEIRDQEQGPGVHYFSISNVMTLLEMNDTFLKDRIVLFDRAIFSAYVWSIYRKRMDKQRLLSEFEKIISSPELYHDCAVVHVTRPDIPTLEKREKDYFGNFENYTEEDILFNEIFKKFNKQLTDVGRNNHYVQLVNDFTETSVYEFCRVINRFAQAS